MILLLNGKRNTFSHSIFRSQFSPSPVLSRPFPPPHPPNSLQRQDNNIKRNTNTNTKQIKHKPKYTRKKSEKNNTHSDKRWKVSSKNAIEYNLCFSTTLGWNLSWSVVHRPSEIPPAIFLFNFRSKYNLQKAFCLGVGNYVSSAFSMYLAWTCAGSVHAALCDFIYT